MNSEFIKGIIAILKDILVKFGQLLNLVEKEYVPVEPEPTPTPVPEPIPEPTPFVVELRNLFASADITTVETKRFLTWVDSGVKAFNAKINQPYGFVAWHAALAYAITKDEKYADCAYSKIAPYIQTQKDLVVSGKAPTIAGDSYLYVGSHFSSLIWTLQYCGHKFSDQEKNDIVDFCEQTLNNIWGNFNTASYYGKVFKWSGWSQNNPGNNYYYSFLLATTLFALYTKSEKWMTYLKTDRFPKVTNYYANLIGGGTREGTGYGLALMELFEVYSIWLDSTNENLALANNHCKETLEYWIHCICPNGKSFSPIGDQARVSSAPVYDYNRRLMLAAAYLVKDVTLTKQMNYVLQYYNTGKMYDGFNYVYDMYPVSKDIEKPTKLNYNATTVGNFFKRSSWEQDATFLTFICGKHTESHLGQPAGSFNLWKNGWATVNANYWSHSGTEQDTLWNNMIRFKDSTGKTIIQQYGDVGPVEVEDNVIRADIGPIYKRTDLGWKRIVNFSSNELRILDDTTLPVGGTAEWQLNVPTLPVVEGNVITTTKIKITVLIPENPIITIQDWKTITSNATGGYRICVQGEDFDIKIELL